MLRALAAALAIALLSALVRVAPAVTSPDETSIQAADHRGQPGEPPSDGPSDSPSKLTAELVVIHPVVVSAPPSGEAPKPASRVGRGELHARLHERPPRAAFLHS